MSLFGKPNIQKMTTNHDVAGLKKALGHKNPSIRASAAKALAEIGATQAQDLLITASNDPDEVVRQAAAQALKLLKRLEWQKNEDRARHWIGRGYKNFEKCIEIGAPAVGPLIETLKSSDVNVFLQASIALQKIGAPAVEPLGVVLLDADDSMMRQRAAQTLGYIGDARAVRPLLAAFKDKDRFVRQIATDALVKISTPAVEPLIAALMNDDPETRWRAARALGKIGDTRALEPLLAAINDKDKEVRVFAVEALGRFGDDRTIEPLLAALEDEELTVRRESAYALAEFGNTRVVETLLEALKDEYENASIRAAYALGKIGDARAVEPLIAAMKSENGEARQMAARDALAEIGAPAIEPLVKALLDDDRKLRSRAVYLLGKIGDARAVEPLRTVLKDEDKYMRDNAATALERLGVQSGQEKEGVRYSEKGLRSKEMFAQLPQSRKICPECKITRGVQAELKVIRETSIPGVLELECPICGHKTGFVPH